MSLIVRVCTPRDLVLRRLASNAIFSILDPLIYSGGPRWLEDLNIYERHAHATLRILQQPGATSVRRSAEREGDSAPIGSFTRSSGGSPYYIRRYSL